LFGGGVDKGDLVGNGVALVQQAGGGVDNFD